MARLQRFQIDRRCVRGTRVVQTTLIASVGVARSNVVVNYRAKKPHIYAGICRTTDLNNFREIHVPTKINFNIQNKSTQIASGQLSDDYTHSHNTGPHFGHLI